MEENESCKEKGAEAEDFISRRDWQSTGSEGAKSMDLTSKVKIRREKVLGPNSSSLEEKDGREEHCRFKDKKKKYANEYMTF